MSNGKQRILVVDDNDEILDFLAMQLDRRGYQVTTCRRGKDALKVATEAPPDLVLLDIMMPDADGFKVCRALKDGPATARVPVIFLTAKTTEVDRLRGFEVGAEDFLVKPFKMHELLSKVQIFLRLKSLMDQADERARRAKELFDVGMLVSSSLDMEEVLASITRSARKLLDADAASIMLKNGGGTHLRVAWAQGAHVEPHVDAEVPIDASISGWVVRRAEPALIDDIEHDPRFASLPRRAAVRSSLVAPLTHRDDTLGTLNVSYLRGGRVLGADAAQLLLTLSTHAAMALTNARLVSSIHDAYLRTIASLAKAVDAKDSYTASHCENVARYATMMAEHLGLARRTVEEIRAGGILHDIGKIGIDDAVLKKKGRLSPEEAALMQHHPVKGHEILKGAGFGQATMDAVLYHHERVDGAGYPEGRAGDAIPIAARIVLVADAFDAMTTDRVYRKALPQEAAIQELRRFQDTQFDRRCIDALVQALRLPEA